jgi:hypothetical protein
MKSSTRPEVVVVTGSSAGLGRAIVQSFAQRGAHIGFVSRSRERLEYACREVKDQGGTAITLPGDVADSATTEEAASRTEDAFGPIDIWVNDAMTTVFSPFHELSADDFRQVTAVTYLGFVYGTMAALKRMRPRNRGTIVQERHREVFEGWPTARAIWGQRSSPVCPITWPRNRPGMVSCMTAPAMMGRSTYTSRSRATRAPMARLRQPRHEQ